MKRVPSFLIYETGVTDFTDAVERILDVRQDISPFDLWVPLSSITFNGDNTVSINPIEGEDVNATRYKMSESALTSVCYLTKVVSKFLMELLPPRVTASVLNAVFKHMVKQRDIKILARCGVSRELSTNSKKRKIPEPKRFVRVFLNPKDRRETADDLILFEYLLKAVPGDIANDYIVRGVWISDIYSAIRVVLNPKKFAFNQTAQLLGCDVEVGFDITNSEVTQNNAWVKWFVRFPDTGAVFILPAVFTALRSMDKSHLRSCMLREIEALSTSEGLEKKDRALADALSEMMVMVPRQNLFRELFRRRLLTSLDIRKLYNINWPEVDYSFSAGNDFFKLVDPMEISIFDVALAVAKFAATFDDYGKRSLLEFIPNIWVRAE